MYVREHRIHRAARVKARESKREEEALCKRVSRERARGPLESLWSLVGAVRRGEARRARRQNNIIGAVLTVPGRPRANARPRPRSPTRPARKRWTERVHAESAYYKSVRPWIKRQRKREREREREREGASAA